MIEISTKSFVIVYTNYFVIVFIIQQTKLSSFSIDKLNFRLIRVSIYLSQFFLKIKHKSSNQHVVSNALSRLFIDALKSLAKSFVLNNVYWQITSQYVYIIEKIKYSKHVVNEIYVNMSSKFKTSIMKNYKQNKSWKQILVLLVKKQKIIVIRKRRQTTNSFTNIDVSTKIIISTKTIIFATNNISTTKSKWQKRQRHYDSDVDFVYRDDLIYHHENDKKKLCLFFNLKTKIFRITHDEINHVDFHRCYQRIVETFYFHKLIKRLRVYIRKCHVCQLNQIKRHAFYDELIFIKITSTFFHTLILNFILILSKCQKYNCILIMICKFIKNIDLFLDKTIYDVVDWIVAILI